MRLLRFPGVVELLDEGPEGDFYTIVMGVVEGAPFPGRPAASTWPAIEPPTLRLLSVLEGVHGAGIVHRDLKPSNVFVDDDGRPTVLDFGLAGGDGVDGSLTIAGSILGTPRYLAPEVAAGRPADARSDLYAVAIMVYEQLSGRLPHDYEDIGTLLRARASLDPEPLASSAPSVPERVALVIDRCLSRDPDRRPRTAREFADWLGGESPPELRHGVPWLGTRAPLIAVESAVLSRSSLCVAGGRGSGRSRVLSHAAQFALAAGRRVVHTRPSTVPFGSLANFPEAEPAADLDLDPAKTHALSVLKRHLSAGLVIIADDLEGLDDLSREVMEGASAHGSVIAAGLKGRHTVRLAELGPPDLVPILHGTERLIHLRSDAAAELIRRSGGNPSRLWHEIQLWDRTGIAQWDGDRLRLTREGLDRLGLVLAPAPTPVSRGRTWRAAPSRATSTSTVIQSGVTGLPAHRQDLVGWVVLAWPRAELNTLVRLTGWPPWRAQAELNDLVRSGLATRRRDGTYVPFHGTAVPWSEERRRSGHLRVAQGMIPGTPGRLQHLVAAGEIEEVVHESAALARAFRLRGALGKARVALVEGLAASRLPGLEGPVADSLLRSLALVALAENTPMALETAIYEFSRRGELEETFRGQMKLMSLALKVHSIMGDERLSEVRELGAFQDPEFERHRLMLWFRLSAGAPEQARSVVIAEIHAFAARRLGPEVDAFVETVRGTDHYRNGRFQDSALAHQRAADFAVSPPERLLALLNSASSHMESGSLQTARLAAKSALILARASRVAFHEGRAEWLLRAIAYRQGRRWPPDLSLVEAARQSLPDDLVALIEIGEAAFAFRHADVETARELASAAALRLRKLKRDASAVLAESIVVLSGGSPSDALNREPLEGTLLSLPPAVALQSAACLVSTGVMQPLAARTASTLASAVPTNRWRQRLELFSVAESLRHLGHHALLRRPSRAIEAAVDWQD